MSFAHPTPDLGKDGHMERGEHISGTSHSIKGQLTPTRLLLKHSTLLLSTKLNKIF